MGHKCVRAPTSYSVYLPWLANSLEGAWVESSAKYEKESLLQAQNRSSSCDVQSAWIWDIGDRSRPSGSLYLASWLALEDILSAQSGLRNASIYDFHWSSAC